MHKNVKHKSAEKPVFFADFLFLSKKPLHDLHKRLCGTPVRRSKNKNCRKNARTRPAKRAGVFVLSFVCAVGVFSPRRLFAGQILRRERVRRRNRRISHPAAAHRREWQFCAAYGSTAAGDGFYLSRKAALSSRRAFAARRAFPACSGFRRYTGPRVPAPSA